MAYQADSVVLAWSFEIIKAGTSENGIPVSDKRARREVRDAYHPGRYEPYWQFDVTVRPRRDRSFAIDILT